MLVLQMGTTVSGLFVGAGDPNSGSYASAASTPLTEPSPQPGDSLSKTPGSALWLPAFHPLTIIKRDIIFSGTANGHTWPLTTG